MQVNALPNSLSGLYSERAGLYWEIWSEDPDFDSDFTAAVRFHYDDVSGLPNENSLELFRRDDATGTWTAATGYVVVTDDGGGSSDSDGIGYVELTITDGTTGAFSGQYILSWSNEPPVVSDIPDQSVAEGSAFATITLDNYVTDPDNGDSEITWTAAGEDDVTVAITDRVATITANNSDWNGTDQVTFTATDPDGEFDSDEVTFEVTAVNDFPVVSDIPDQSVAEGAAFATINLDDYVTDIDNAINTMNWTASGQSNLSVDITDRVATITANDGNWNGDETITFQAADPSGGTDSDQATFTVTPVNDPPVIDDIPHQSILQGESFVPINLDDYVADPDDADNTLAWSVSGDAQVTVDITDRVATVTVNDPQWNGADWVIFTVEDPDGLVDRDTVRFHVADSNDPPVVDDIPDQTIAEGQLFSQISLDNYVTDPDDPDESISWVASGLTNLSVSIVNRVATVTPVDPDWNGAESIIFTAEDPMGEEDSDTATFTITPTNDPPVVSGIPDLEGEEGSNFQETINLDAQVADIDNEDSEITWTIDGDSNVTVTILSRIAYITPGNNPDWNGIDTLVFTATDPSGAIGRDTCLFTVTGVQDAPRLGKAIPDTLARVDQVFSMVLDSTYLVDVDPGDSLAYSALISKGGLTPAWITFEPVTRTFSGTPAIADTGMVEVIVTATDDSLESVADTFLIEVTTATGVLNPLDGLEIKLYPNPNDGRFVIEGEMFELRDVVLEIFNERGQLVWNRKIMDEIGTLRESVDLSNAADGLYLLRIRNKSGMVNKRFVKGY